MKDWFMNLLYYLKRPLIWLSRFRYRCGYGVHSPFAFSLITDVIYEKMPYYAYDLLKAEQNHLPGIFLLLTYQSSFWMPILR